MLRLPTVDRLQRGGDDVDTQYHARAAAVRLVVDLPRPERRRLAVAEQPKIQLAAEDRRDRSLLAEPGERVRNIGEDVELHEDGLPQVTVGQPGSAKPT